MPLLKPLNPLCRFLSEQLDGKYDQTKNKDQQADPVDPMHVADPLAFWTIRIFFLYVEILGNLIPDSHDWVLSAKIRRVNGE